MAEQGGAPLSRKLGIRPGSRIAVICGPDDFPALLGGLPPDARLVGWPQAHSDVVVVFATRMAELKGRFNEALPALAVDGGLWICYPKRASGVETNLTFANVQELGLAAGLVDNKIASIDATWSGMRFVVRLVDRPSWRGGALSASGPDPRAAREAQRPSSAPRGGRPRRR